MATSGAYTGLQELRLRLQGRYQDGGAEAKKTGLALLAAQCSAALLGAWSKVTGAYSRVDGNDRSLWLFAREHPVRQKAKRTAEHPWFGRTVLTLVLASCLVLALDDPGCTDVCAQKAVLNKVVSDRCRRCDMYKKASVVLNLFFTITFTIEIMIKAVNMNFAFGPGAYMKSGWNWIDFLSTMAGYLQYLPIGDSGGLSGIRAMRALRPLRALTAIPGLKMLVECLLEAVPLLVDVICLLTWVFFVFGIVALNLFMGTLHKRCMAPVANGTWAVLNGYDNDPCGRDGGPGLLQCPTGSYCNSTNTNPNYGYTSFDNFGAASYAIFQMLTMDNWTGSLLYPLMNVIGPAVPIPYFVLLVLFGAFFAMQLLVAILSSKFAQLSAQMPKKPKKKKRRRRRLRTPPDTDEDDDEEEEEEQQQQQSEQRKSDGGDAPAVVGRRRRAPPSLLTRLRRWWRKAWFRFHRRYLLALRRKDLPRWRQAFWDVTYSVWFNNVMTAFIIANTVTMALEHHGQSDGFIAVLERINLALTAGFILECVIKHTGVGVVGYWRDPWNILDGLIVALSIVELLLTYAVQGGGANTQSLRTFRLLRILRSLKLLARIEALRKLMRMVIKGFVALKDFLLLLVLFIFIFSILGLQQFGGAWSFKQGATNIWRSNFETLWQSAYTVFQLLTADNWVAISWNGMRARGIAASLYFVAWTIIGNFVLMTLFLAILITNFQTDEDEVPTEEELNANPYAPENQSETASTVFSAAPDGGGGGPDPRNALQQRLAARTDAGQVLRLKRWLVLMGVEHGIRPQEVAEIEVHLDTLAEEKPDAFQPGSAVSPLDLFEDDGHVKHSSATGGKGKGLPVAASLRRRQGSLPKDDATGGGAGGGGHHGSLLTAAGLRRKAHFENHHERTEGPADVSAAKPQHLGRRSASPWAGHTDGRTSQPAAPFDELGAGDAGVKASVRISASGAAVSFAAARSGGGCIGTAAAAGCNTSSSKRPTMVAGAADDAGGLDDEDDAAAAPLVLAKKGSSGSHSSDGDEPVRRLSRRGFLNKWQNWFDDAEDAPPDPSADSQPLSPCVRAAAGPAGANRPPPSSTRSAGSSRSSARSRDGGPAAAATATATAEQPSSSPHAPAACGGRSMLLGDDDGPCRAELGNVQVLDGRHSGRSRSRSRRSSSSSSFGSGHADDAYYAARASASIAAPGSVGSPAPRSSVPGPQHQQQQQQQLQGQAPSELQRLPAEAPSPTLDTEPSISGGLEPVVSAAATRRPLQSDQGGDDAAQRYTGAPPSPSTSASQASTGPAPSPVRRLATSTHAQRENGGAGPSGCSLVGTVGAGLRLSPSLERRRTTADAGDAEGSQAGGARASGAIEAGDIVISRVASADGGVDLEARRASGGGSASDRSMSSLSSASTFYRASDARPRGPSARGGSPSNRGTPQVQQLRAWQQNPAFSDSGAASGGLDSGTGSSPDATWRNRLHGGSSTQVAAAAPATVAAVVAAAVPATVAAAVAAAPAAVAAAPAAVAAAAPPAVAALPEPAPPPPLADAAAADGAGERAAAPDAPHSSSTITDVMPGRAGGAVELPLEPVQEAPPSQQSSAGGERPLLQLMPHLATTHAEEQGLVGLQQLLGPKGSDAPSTSRSALPLHRVGSCTAAWWAGGGDGSPLAAAPPVARSGSCVATVWPYSPPSYPAGLAVHHDARSSRSLTPAHAHAHTAATAPPSSTAVGGAATPTAAGNAAAAASATGDVVRPRYTGALQDWWWQPATALISSAVAAAGAVAGAALSRQVSHSPPSGASRSTAVATHAPAVATAGPAAAVRRSRGSSTTDWHGSDSDGGGHTGPGPVAEAVVASAGAAGAAARAKRRAQEAARQAAGGGEAAELPAAKQENSTLYLESSSMYLLRPHHPARLRLQALISNRYFEGFIMLMILGSSIILAMDAPTLDPESSMALGIKYTEWVLNILFTIEMVMKLMLKGWLFHPGAYWRTPWDILDGVIVVTSLVSMVAPNISFFRTLRLLRVLRPLRMISRVQGMRLVVETLIRSLPAVANVVLFGGFMFGIFGILGTQLFMGRLARCNQAVADDGTPIATREQCTPGTFTCTALDLCDALGTETQRWWGTPFRNFDHFGRSLLTLFIVATLDGFMDLAYNLMDATDVDKQPQVNHAPYLGLYVLAFVFLGAFFWINLLVSVIIDYYTRLVAEQGEMLQSKEAKEWMKVFQFTAKNAADAWRAVPVPSNALRRRAYNAASSPAFDNFIMAIILSNVLVMAMPHQGATPAFEDAMIYLNMAFTIVFMLEAIIKNLAMGFRLYIRDHWNKLDLFIILTSIPDLLSSFVPMGGSSGAITVLRILRIGRMFKLIKNAKGLRTLFNTLINSLPAIFNVGSLLFLLMFVYGVLGMNLFGGPGNPFEASTATTFHDFGSSLIALFKAFTGDGWSDVMAQASGCDGQGFNCKTGGQAVVSCLFFCTFMVLATFVMLNLVIAVILDNFISSAQSEGLLKTSNFTDVMRTITTLRVFVRMLRGKIEEMKERDAVAAAAAATAAAAAPDGRRRVRKKATLSGLVPPGGTARPNSSVTATSPTGGAAAPSASGSSALQQHAAAKGMRASATLLGAQRSPYPSASGNTAPGDDTARRSTYGFGQFLRQASDALPLVRTRTQNSEIVSGDASWGGADATAGEREGSSNGTASGGNLVVNGTGVQRNGSSGRRPA